jgi:hypothetical protein
MLVSGPFGEFKGLLPNDPGFTHRHRNLPSAADQGVTWAASAQVGPTSVSGVGPHVDIEGSLADLLGECGQFGGDVADADRVRLDYSIWPASLSDRLDPDRPDR